MIENDESDKSNEINTSIQNNFNQKEILKKSRTNVDEIPKRRFSRLYRTNLNEPNFISFKYTKNKSIINPQQFNVKDSTIFSKHLSIMNISNQNEITGIPEDKKYLNEKDILPLLKIEKITDIKIFKKSIEIKNEGNKKLQILEFYYQIEGKVIYTKKDIDDNFYDYEYNKSYIPMKLFDDNQEIKIIGEDNDPKINNIISLLNKCNKFLSNYLEIGNRLLISFKSSIEKASFSDYIEFLIEEKKNKEDEINLDILNESIDEYVEETVSDFENKLMEILEDTEFENRDISIAIESLFQNEIFEDETFKQSTNFTIFHELLDIQRTVIPSFFIRLNQDINFEAYDNEENEEKKNEEFNHLKEAIFYNLMLKINHYYKLYYPLCCGAQDLKDIHYIKSPYVFCFDCKLLICKKCFYKHKKHNYFDIVNTFMRKIANIHTDKSMFINSNPNKLKTISEEYAEDLILKYLIYFMDSKINEILKKRERKYITILDFIDLILYETLIKKIFPYTMNKSYLQMEIKNIIEKKKNIEDNDEKGKKKYLKLAFENVEKIYGDFDTKTKKNEITKNLNDIFPEIELFFDQTDGQDTFQTDYIMNCKDEFLQVLRAHNVFKKELKIAKNINSLKSQINDIFLNKEYYNEERKGEDFIKKLNQLEKNPIVKIAWFYYKIDNNVSQIQFIDGLCPLFEYVKIFLDDLFNTVANFGSYKYEKKISKQLENKNEEKKNDNSEFNKFHSFLNTNMSKRLIDAFQRYKITEENEENEKDDLKLKNSEKININSKQSLMSIKSKFEDKKINDQEKIDDAEINKSNINKNDINNNNNEEEEEEDEIVNPNEEEKEKIDSV